MYPIKFELSEDERNEAIETLSEMLDPVEIHIFVSNNCPTCGETIKLVEFVKESAPDGKVITKVFDKAKNHTVLEKEGVRRIPTLTLLDGMIKYTGIPSGEEFRGFIETIMRLSEGESGLEDETGRKLVRLGRDIYVEVIVTPPCPYCPYAALLSNMFAFESWKTGSKRYVSDIVEAYENPDIADRYNVQSVPTITINGVKVFIGLPVEEDFINYVEYADRGEIEKMKMKDYGDATGL
ncbi:MAG: thioredoxin family protein [Desulfurococcales archaeon]|nr:thioredoxin family protein [Desulfurococcales archaeon]